MTTITTEETGAATFLGATWAERGATRAFLAGFGCELAVAGFVDPRLPNSLFVQAFVTLHLILDMLDVAIN
jgi:hypothetical protein